MIKRCPLCLEFEVKKDGKTSGKKQRYWCRRCKKSFVWKNHSNKAKREQIWFEWWIKEGLSIRQIHRISKHSIKKIKQIKNKWLEEEPPALYKDYKNVRYLIFDGTYFKRTNSFLLFEDNKVISCCYVDSESYENVYRMAIELKACGVNPKSITIDGLKPVIRAVQDVWPDVIIQRCLYHIEHQGLMWIRSKPKTEAGRELRKIYYGITAISDEAGREDFTNKYKRFLGIYG